MHLDTNFLVGVMLNAVLAAAPYGAAVRRIPSPRWSVSAGPELARITRSTGIRVTARLNSFLHCVLGHRTV